MPAQGRFAAAQRWGHAVIVMIDNYDSFTWNLVQAFWSLGAEVKVVANDAVSLSDIEAMAPRGIVVSPGPCSPAEAGISVAAIRHFADRLPVFGVCLGHQALGAAFGAAVVRAPKPVHGKVEPVAHGGRGLFAGVASPMLATRYHSLVVDEATLPSTLQVEARHADEPGLVMALQLAGKPVFGVQFHPESIMTTDGPKLLANFVRTTQA